MEMELNSLIEKIKTEGISTAKQASQDIISRAEEKSSAIINQAEEKAGLIIEHAKEEAGRLADNSQHAIRQAVRDATLSLKQEIKDLFDSLLKTKIQQALSDDQLVKELILKIAAVWSKDKTLELEILVSQHDQKRLEKLILSQLKNELKSGLTFKARANIDKGLYVGRKGEDFYYDFTDQSITEILKEYLRPFIVKILERQNNK